MNVRSLFHVSPMRPVPPKDERPPMPTLVDIHTDIEDPKPRGRSFETWLRARGWASED
jgi:hypothetical protein